MLTIAVERDDRLATVHDGESFDPKAATSSSDLLAEDCQTVMKRDEPIVFAWILKGGIDFLVNACAAEIKTNILCEQASILYPR